MARPSLFKKLPGKSGPVLETPRQRDVRAVDVMASEIVTLNFDEEIERIAQDCAREMEEITRVYRLHGDWIQAQLRLRAAHFHAAQLIRQMNLSLELKRGRMQSLRKELFARFRRLFRLIRDLLLGRSASFLRKRHRRLINRTDFSHDHSLIHLKCALPVLNSLSSPEAITGPVKFTAVFQ